MLFQVLTFNVFRPSRDYAARNLVRQWKTPLVVEKYARPQNAAPFRAARLSPLRRNDRKRMVRADGGGLYLAVVLPVFSARHRLGCQQPYKA